MSTLIIGEEPSTPLMARSTSATSRTSAAVSSSSSSRPSSSGASSTTASSSSSRPSSSKAALSMTASSSSSSRPSSSKAASLTTATTIAKSEPGSAIVKYTTIPALFQRIRHATEESITVHNISSQEFTQFFEQREEQEGTSCNFRIWLYRADTKCMIITIPTAKHEGLHRVLDDCFRDDAVSMGLRREFFPIGSTTYKDKDANGNIVSEGEGDSCRKPASRVNEDDYPTLVIEAGWSQTLKELQEKARWWFDKSKGDVKIVLLVKSSLGSNHIRIEKWKLAPAASRQGATTTRAATAMTPQCVHVVEIARAAGINNGHPNQFDLASYVVTGGPLQLEFIDIFLRQPIPPGERDLVLSNTILQEYAADLWRVMQ